MCLIKNDCSGRNTKHVNKVPCVLNLECVCLVIIQYKYAFFHNDMI